MMTWFPLPLIILWIVVSCLWIWALQGSPLRRHQILFWFWTGMLAYELVVLYGKVRGE